MKATLGIVGYTPILEIAKKIAGEFRRSAHFIFVNSILEEAQRPLRELEGAADIVLTGPSTRRLFADHLAIPIIAFRPSFPDLIKAIEEARRYDRRIAICLSRDDLEFDLPLLSKVMSVSLAPHYCDTGAEYTHAVETFKKEGFKVVIGGAFPTKVANQVGLQGVCFYKGMDMIRTAVQKALEICQIQREGIQRLSQLTAVVNNFTEGLLLTDESGRVILDNPPAQAYLGMEKIRGRKLEKLLASEVPRQILRQPHKVLNALEKGNLVVNYVPVRSAGRIHGLICTFKKTDEIQDAEFAVRRKMHERGFTSKYKLQDIVGASPAIRSCKEWVGKFAPAEGPILITGETGTGKELFAHSIHEASPRRPGPFVAINCATLPGELLESELFGYEKGAFTGAHTSGKKGLIELAHKGTLFLDEITSLNQILQAKLLRLLSEKEILKIGSDRIIPVEIRIIAATNEEIESCVVERRFREDLYYRLSAFRLHIPALRERPEDIVPIFLHFIRRHRPEIAGAVSRNKKEIYQTLAHEPFPGNVRELENVARRFCQIFRPGEPLKQILEACRQRRMALAQEKEAAGDLKQTVQAAEKMILQDLLARYRNKADISALLRVDRSTLWRKMKKYGL